MGNPYHYGTPVSGEHFAGREMEVAALVDRMRDGINVVLLSPRRYGKTSLLARAGAAVTGHGGAVIQLNVLRSRDLASFAGLLAAGAFHARGGRWHRARHAVPEFLSRLRVAPGVSFDGDRPRFTFNPSLSTPDVDDVIADVYALLAELATAAPAALVLDEFQAITDLGAHLPRLLKGLADEHPGVSLVLAGSRRHLMEQLVTAADAPLFGMAEHLALDTLPEQTMCNYLVRRAREGGKPMSASAAGLLWRLAGPVPNDVQHLAYEVFGLADLAIDESDVERGLLAAVEHEAALHADRFETLAPGQRRLLTELADAPIAEPYAAAVARRVQLANAASVARALDALVSAELVVRRDGSYQVASPFFAAWLRG